MLQKLVRGRLLVSVQGIKGGYALARPQQLPDRAPHRPGRQVRQGGHAIAIAGLSYKPQTPVVEESHSVKLAAQLADAGYVVVVHDPLAQDAALAVLGDKVVGASSLEGACASATC